MFRYLISFSFFIISFSSVLQANETEFYFDSNLYGHSQTSSITQIVLDEFEGEDFDGGEHSFTHNIWEIGGVYKGLKLAAVARYDYTLNYTEDVAELVFREKNDKPIETNRTYDLYLDVLHMRSTGLKFGYQYKINNDIKISADASWLQVTSYMQGFIDGRVEVTDDDYVGDIALDYVYSKDKLLDRIARRPKGYGYTLDFHVQSQLTDSLALSISFLDLVNEINIKEAPYTAANATSNRLSISPEGLIDVKPILTGVEDYRDHRLKLEPRYDAEFLYGFDELWDVYAGVFHYDDYTYSSLGFGYKVTESLGVKTVIDLKTQALELNLQSQAWSVGLISDDFNLNDARTFGLSWSLRY